MPEVIRTIPAMQARSRALRAEGRTIGLVPTMGALHEGHLSLMRRSGEENDVSAISIYVNPTQFAPGEDFERYPRPFDDDVAMAAGVGVDLVFTTTDAEMYPGGYSTYVVEEEITGPLCGASRPGHFRGVLTVVLKLFHVVGPDRAYFGEKDFQQLLAIRKMATDLDLGVEVIGCPIVREPDGLALSSRNAYLGVEERREALVLSRSLEKAASLVEAGLTDVPSLRERVEEEIRMAPSARIDYVEIRDAATLAPVDRLDRPVVVALAVHIGKTRLIDNRVIHPDEPG